MLGIFRKKKEVDDGIDRNYYVNKYLKFSIYSDNNAIDVDANGDIIITGRGSTQMDIMNKAGQTVASKNITVY